MGSGCSCAHAAPAQQPSAAVCETVPHGSVIPPPAVDQRADEAHARCVDEPVDPAGPSLQQSADRWKHQDDALRPPSPSAHRRSLSNPLEWPSDVPPLVAVQRERSADTPLVRLMTLSSGASRSANEPFSTSQSLQGPHSTSDFAVAVDRTTATTTSPQSSATTGSESAAGVRAAKERDPPLAGSHVSSWTSSTCRQFALLSMPSAVDDIASAVAE